jgi:hypothetical protein
MPKGDAAAEPTPRQALDRSGEFGSAAVLRSRRGFSQRTLREAFEQRPAHHIPFSAALNLRAMNHGPNKSN